MQVREGAFLDLLGADGVRFMIPVYQRVYSWSEQQYENPWRDIMRAGTLASDNFVGTVLYCVEAEDERQLDVIDGQSADDIGKAYTLVGSAEKKMPKLVLARADRETFAAVMGAGDMPEQASQRVIESYGIFRSHMQEADFDVRVLWSGIRHLTAIVASLEDGDSPQLIFESLNSKGMPLTGGLPCGSRVRISMTQARSTMSSRAMSSMSVTDRWKGSSRNYAISVSCSARRPRATPTGRSR